MPFRYDDKDDKDYDRELKFYLIVCAILLMVFAWVVGKCNSGGW